jgi:hypothetical protein
MSARRTSSTSTVSMEVVAAVWSEETFSKFHPVHNHLQLTTRGRLLNLTTSAWLQLTTRGRLWI